MEGDFKMNFYQLNMCAWCAVNTVNLLTNLYKYLVYIRGEFNKFPYFFVQPFKIVVDPWKFTMLLLYILWDDRPIFMISGSNEQLLKPDCDSWWIWKMQSGRVDTLQERYVIIFCFKLGKNATEKYGMLQTAFGQTCMNRASVFETIWPRRTSRQFLTLPIVQNLLPVTFGYSLSSEAVVMRQSRRWKRLWRRSSTHSHKRTSMGPSRRCWNGTTNALQPEEITSKGTRVLCVYCQ